jgi:MTH538 TIR-like domain (DUF1863)
MAKRVFFSFHYRDVSELRANVVRNHGLTKDHSSGFFDASLWESVKRNGPTALKRLINDGLENTSARRQLLLPVGDNYFCRRRAGEEPAGDRSGTR